jgi:hypothetical protein
VRAPDSAVPLEAYRVWGVTPELRLQSVTSGFCGGITVWTPHEAFSAACLAASSCGGAPNPDHTCGIYAYKALTDAMLWASKLGRIRPVVIGTVKLWGTVVETTAGWRAEFAYPKALLAGRELKPLAAAYGVACDD